MADGGFRLVVLPFTYFNVIIGVSLLLLCCIIFGNIFSFLFLHCWSHKVWELSLWFLYGTLTQVLCEHKVFDKIPHELQLIYCTSNNMYISTSILLHSHISNLGACLYPLYYYLSSILAWTIVFSVVTLSFMIFFKYLFFDASLAIKGYFRNLQDSPMFFIIYLLSLVP